MKSAARTRISRLLPLVVLMGLALSAPTVSAGVNVWTTNGPNGRDIRALAIDPTNPATVYAGTLPAGVFKSSNGGESWRAVNNGLRSTGVLALAVDPSAPATLYAGTDGGVFKSSNGGESWRAVNSGLSSSYVNALAIDPSAPATLYAGTSGSVGSSSGVFKTTDGGQSWTPMNAGLTSTFVYSLVVDPSAPATVYAGASGGVFKSENGGETWTISNMAPSFFIYALAIDPSSPATLYAGADSFEYPGGVFMTSNGGADWTTNLFGPGIASLAIDASAPGTLYAGTSASTSDGGVFESSNGGQSSTAINAGLTSLVINALAMDRSTSARLYAGTSGGGVFEYRTGEIGERRILPVVGSTPGANGTFFRTSVQLNNPSTEPATGRIVFHPSGAAGSDSDPALSYSLAPGQTQSIADLLPAMGISGIGSADLEVISGTVPVVSARVFNDAGSSGTTGFTEEAMRAEEALHPGQPAVLLIPPDFDVARFNVGVRTLTAGASVTFTVRNASGAEVGTASRSFPPSYHEQATALEFLGPFEIPAGGSIAVSVTAGSTIVYGATVDNRTGDPSFQIARFSPWDY